MKANIQFMPSTGSDKAKYLIIEKCGHSSKLWLRSSLAHHRPHHFKQRWSTLAVDGFFLISPVHTSRTGHPYLIEKLELSLQSIMGATEKR
jgi:hypothetical protein